jgi:hypothetical protein
MRGFLVGSLALVVLYVLVQPGTAAKADTASGVVTTALKHLLSGDFAAIPDRSGTQRKFSKTLTTSTGTGSGSGSTTPATDPSTRNT